MPYLHQVATQSRDATPHLFKQYNAEKKTDKNRRDIFRADEYLKKLGVVLAKNGDGALQRPDRLEDVLLLAVEPVRFR